MAVADIEQHRLDALLLHGLAMDLRHPERSLVKGDRAVEIRDRDAHVIDQPEHAPESMDLHAPLLQGRATVS